MKGIILLEKKIPAKSSLLQLSFSVAYQLEISIQIIRILLLEISDWQSPAAYMQHFQRDFSRWRNPWMSAYIQPPFQREFFLWWTLQVRSQPQPPFEFESWHSKATAPRNSQNQKAASQSTNKARNTINCWCWMQSKIFDGTRQQVLHKNTQETCYQLCILQRLSYY